MRNATEVLNTLIERWPLGSESPAKLRGFIGTHRAEIEEQIAARFEVPLAPLLPVSPPSKRTIQSPSRDQRAIFDYIQHGTGNLIVQAVAGSGKTSTIMHAMGLLPPGEDAIYVVFNTRNRDEAAERLVGTQVRATTLNSLGRSMLQGKGWTLEKYKVQKAWKEAADRGWLKYHEARDYREFAMRLVNLARQVGIGAFVPDEFDAWMHLCEQHDLVPEESGTTIEQGIKLSRAFLERLNELSWAKVIDFADQIYLPVHPDFKAQVRVPRPKWIFVDETQDLSPVQVQLVAAMMGLGADGSVRRVPGSPQPRQRVVFVGDRWQAIYGWRGAMNDAMDNIKARFACEEMPLSVCWRCDVSIVEMAARLGAPIRPAPGKEYGEVVHHEAGSPFRAKNGQVVLCRTTAPLVQGAMRLIRQGRNVIVLGRDIGEDLVSLAQKMGEPHEDVNVLLAALDRWELRELERLADHPQQAESVQDRAASLRALADRLKETGRTIGDLFKAIRSLFGDENDANARRDAVVFSSIHKSKGLEWDEVVILDYDKMPAKWAVLGWQRQQEINCMYVAVTRARHRLFLVRSGDFEPGRTE